MNEVEIVETLALASVGRSTQKVYGTSEKLGAVSGCDRRSGLDWLKGAE